MLTLFKKKKKKKLNTRGLFSFFVVFLWSFYLLFVCGVTFSIRG